MLDFKKLEEKRQAMYQAYQSRNKIAIILAIVGVILLIAGYGIPFTPLMIIGLIAIVIAMIVFGLAQTYQQKFRKEIKPLVVDYILKDLFDDVAYYPNQHIDIQNIKYAGLVKSPDRYSGEDFLSGKYKGVSFYLSDVDLKERVVRRDSKGNTYVTYETYFKGRWYVYQFNRTFKDVLKIAEIVPINVNGLTKIDTESIEFNKKFRVYASTQEHAFYMITPLMLERLMKFEQAHRGRVMLCFIGNQLHVGVNDSRNYLELNFKKTLNEEELAYFLDDFEIIQAIINEFRLDTPKFNHN